MPAALSLAPLTLAAVLTLSGLAKLRDPRSTASMIRLLRLPNVLQHQVVPHALPVVELTTAVLLLTPWRWTYAAGAAVALVLFTAFLVVIARAMTFDPRPTCGCFGRVGDHRVNAQTVGRNILLLVLAMVAAGLAVAGTNAGTLVAGYGVGDWLWLLSGVALATVAVLVLGGPAVGPSRPERRRMQPDVFRQDGEVTAPPQEGELDYLRAPIPRGAVLDRELQVRTLHELTRSRAQLLVLVNCWCGSTVVAIDRLPGWRERLPQLGVQLVHTLTPWDEPRLAELDGVWWDPGSHVYDALRATGSPVAVLLGADGLLAGGPVTGLEEIDGLVGQIEAQLEEAQVAAEP